MRLFCLGPTRRAEGEAFLFPSLTPPRERLLASCSLMRVFCACVIFHRRREVARPATPRGGGGNRQRESNRHICSWVWRRRLRRVWGCQASPISPPLSATAGAIFIASPTPATREWRGRRQSPLLCCSAGEGAALE